MGGPSKVEDGGAGSGTGKGGEWTGDWARLAEGLDWEPLGPPSETPKEKDLEVRRVSWEVPAEDLRMSRPAQISGTRRYGWRWVERGRLRLGCQLTAVAGVDGKLLRLSQAPEDGSGEKLPLRGLEWALLAERTDGGQPSQLNQSLREALGHLRAGSGVPQLLSPRAVWARRHVFPGQQLRLSVLLRASPALLAPTAVLERMAKDLEKEADTGLVGQLLWKQVEAVLEGDGEGDLWTDAHPCADVLFRCGDGARLGAHKAVLMAKAPQMARLWASQPDKERWVVGAGSIPAASLREVLHWLYLGGFSPGLHRAPLSGVLEGVRALGLGRLPLLRLECLLLQLELGGNRLRLASLALSYRLPVLANVLRAEAARDPDFARRLRSLTHELHALRHLPSSLSPDLPGATLDPITHA